MTTRTDELQLAFLALEEVEAAWERAYALAAVQRSGQELEDLAQRLVEVADEFAAVSARVLDIARSAHAGAVA